MSLLHRTRDTDDVHTTAAEDGERDRHEREISDDRNTVIRERTWTFAPGQLISLLIGIGLAVVGLVALIRAGIDGDLSEPVVDVLGLSHTAWLGVAEIGVGALLILAGTGAWGRAVSVVLGAGMMIAGVLIGVETSAMPEELGLESDYGWMLVLVGAVVALAAMVLPVWRSRRIRRDGVDVDDDRALVTH
jgi:hypothetical protein